MSVHAFFELSQGLTKPMTVPKGTLAGIREHIAAVEAALGLEKTQYLKNPPHWKTTKPKDGVTDEVLCRVAGGHNAWVRQLYADFATWSKTPPKSPNEVLRVKAARDFWHGLREIDVPAHRWTEEYYRERMEHLYDVMRGVKSEGVQFDQRALTPKQAGAVIRLFEEFLDPGDLRLEVPNGRDELRSSNDGGYDWCEKCGPVAGEDVELCRRRKCPLREERKALDERDASNG